MGADSLDAIEIMMALEEEFKTTISDADALELRTVQDVIGYIKEQAEKKQTK